MSMDLTKVRLVGLVGLGKVAVLEGPLESAELVESWRLFESGAIDAAIKRLERHARGLAVSAPDRLVSMIYVGPDSEPYMVAEPRPAEEIAKADIPRLDWPLLQPTHVHRNARVGSYLILDVTASNRSITVRMVSKNPLGSRFDHKKYRYTYDGIGFARSGNYLLVNGDLVRTSTFDDARAEVMQVDASAPVILRYSYDDGITLTGNTKFHKDRIADTRGTTKIYKNRPIGLVPSERAYSFEWSGRQQVWYVPKSRQTLHNRASIDEIASALRRSGIPTINIEYAAPDQVGSDSDLLSRPLPEPEPPAPQPHGWPPIPLDANVDRHSREQQLQRLPRYRKDNYRWHRVRLSHPAETPVNGLATNIDGHVVVGHPPTAVFGPFWTLSIDDERWGRGEQEFAVVANRFHQEVVPTLEPLPLPPAGDEPEDIDAARAKVRERKARSTALANVAQSAGVEICPRAVFGLAPVPKTHAEIRARAEQYADIVKRYRALHQIELYAAGKLAEPPERAFATLSVLGTVEQSIRRDLYHPQNRTQALEWARGRYQSWLDVAAEIIAPDDPKEAARVLDTCVRDVEGGGRRLRLDRANQLREHSRRTREPLTPTPTVVPPIAKPTSSEAGVQPRPRKSAPRSQPTSIATPTSSTQPFDTEQLAAAWAAHVAARRPEDLPWTNVPKTSCFTTDEDVTLCTAFQTKPIGTCPPSMAGASNRARQVMLCGDEDQVYYFGSLVDAKTESANLVQRRRQRALAERPRPEFPAADDFAAQERFLDSLVPTRLVFRPNQPFDLLSVAVAPVHVRTAEVSSTIQNWVKREVPDGATLEAQVVVGASHTMPLREFVDTLVSKYVPYVGAATPETLGKLLEHADRDQHKRLKERLTANDVQHGVFDGRSLYWLYDAKAGELIGPVNAKGNLGTATARDEILVRETRPLPLPDTLPSGWTLDDAIVLSLIIRGQQRFIAWNAKTSELSSLADGDWTSPSPLPLRATWEATKGFVDFYHQAPYTLLAALDHQPGNVRFRVAGPWLGVVFPSDFDTRVAFDPPTGGELDVDQLAGDIATYTALLEQKPEEWALQQWVKVAPKRVAWAKRYLKGQTPKSTAKQPSANKPRKSGEISEHQRQLLSIAANAWIDAPGSSTNYVGRKEIGVAESLIDAGFLEQTDEGTFADQPAIEAKLTTKGRKWLLENLRAAFTPENIQQLETAPRGKRLTMKTPAPESTHAPEPMPAPEPSPAARVPKSAPKKRSAPKKSGDKKVAKKPAAPKKQAAAEQLAAPKQQAAAEQPAAPKKQAVPQQTSKKKSSKRETSAKKTSAPKVAAEASAKKTSAKKTAAKKTAAKKPNWRYTVHQDVRHRYRELDGTFVVERNTDGGWSTATAAAAKSIHAKSESACALAARILPTCGPQRPNAKRRALRPSAAEKDAMRRLLGL